MTYFRDLPPHVQEAWRAAHGAPAPNMRYEPECFPWESPFDNEEERIERLKAAYVRGDIDLETFERRLDRTVGIA